MSSAKPILQSSASNASALLTDCFLSRTLTPFLIMVWYFASGAIALTIALVTFGLPENPFLGVSSAPHDPYIEVESEDEVKFTFMFILALAVVVGILLEVFYFVFQFDLDDNDEEDAFFPFLVRGFRQRRMCAILYATVRLPLLVAAFYIDRWLFFGTMLWLPILLVVLWIFYAPILCIMTLAHSIQRDIAQLGTRHISV